MRIESQGLLKILNGHFNWNKSRMSCFVGMLLALIQVRSVNLAELSCGFGSKAKKESSYKRMQRFFRHFSIDLSELAKWVLSWIGASRVVINFLFEQLRMLFLPVLGTSKNLSFAELDCISC
jgi:hypothetical protein